LRLSQYGDTEYGCHQHSIVCILIERRRMLQRTEYATNILYVLLSGECNPPLPLKGNAYAKDSYDLKTQKDHIVVTVLPCCSELVASERQNSQTGQRNHPPYLRYGGRIGHQAAFDKLQMIRFTEGAHLVGKVEGEQLLCGLWPAAVIEYNSLKTG